MDSEDFMSKINSFIYSILAPMELIKKNDKHNKFVDEYYTNIKLQYGAGCPPREQQL